MFLFIYISFLAQRSQFWNLRMPYYFYTVSSFMCTMQLFLQVHFACALCVQRHFTEYFYDRRSQFPTYTNLEIASPKSITATRLDKLVYSPNCYIQIFRRNFSPAAKGFNQLAPPVRTITVALDMSKDSTS